MNVWIQILLALITALLGGGIGVAIVKGRFDVRLKRMDQSAQERQEMRQEMKDLKSKFAELYLKYLDILEQNSEIRSKSKNQAEEIERLKKQVSELRGYKSQSIKIDRIRKHLSEYYKSNKVESLIKGLEKELL